MKQGLERVAELVSECKQAAACVSPSGAGKVSKAARRRARRAAFHARQRSILGALGEAGVYVNGGSIRTGKGGLYGMLAVSNYQSKKA